MAKRIVFRVTNSDNLIEEELVDFTYYSGFAISQKQKSVKSLHEEILKKYSCNVLEVSSKSLNDLGIKLSAFNLKVNVDGKIISLENIFQASKVFENGGPYTDLLDVKPIEAKKDDRIRNSGNLIKFTFKDKDYPIVPRTAFYDYFYCCALYKNPELVSELIKYDIFTDIEFNHEKSLNCQARSAAIFVSLYRNNLLKNYIHSFEDFVKLPVYNTKNNNGIQLKLF